MCKLTWIASVLVCAGCVVSQSSQDDKAATVGKPAERVEEMQSINPTPVSRQETAVSRSVTRQSPQPVKTSTPILSVSPKIEKAHVVKTETPPATVANAKVQKAEANTPVPVIEREEPPANIIIKGTPKTKSESNEKLSGNKFVWAGITGGIAVALGGWVFVQRKGKPQRAEAKGKNLNKANDEVDKAWKKGGVF
jgi:hypothetical protein